jgi:hypothetical protein
MNRDKIALVKDILVILVCLLIIASIFTTSF